MSAPAMSRHLRVLRDSGLVEEEIDGEDGRARVYSLRKEPFRGLRKWLEEVETFWALELAAFKEHAERTRASTSGAVAPSKGATRGRRER
jgi:DNA-binding transcriptional ArsR family regulator